MPQTKCQLKRDQGKSILLPPKDAMSNLIRRRSVYRDGINLNLRNYQLLQQIYNDLNKP